jgi:glutaredoxin
LNAQVLGISIDHVPCLRAWAESLGGVSFPLLSDFWPHGELASQFGVLREDGTTERAIFIINPDGIICYVDVHNIDDQPDNEVLFAELERLLPPDAVKAAHANRPNEADLPSGGVVMYCTPWCHDCTKAKEWLRARQIPFREVNISLNSAAAQRVRQWANGDLVTPTFDIEGTIVVDFDEQRLSAVLGVA